MLYLIGLGLKDEESLSLEAVDILRKCDKVFLENYTSRQVNFNLNKLESLLSKRITIADRKFVENTKNILGLAKEEDAALLVSGDPMIATTHLEIVLDAEKEGVKVRILNNASILNAVSNIGLEIYKFGKIASIPFTTKSFMPETPYNILKDNLSINAHTLFLFDLHLDEDKFMNFKEALTYLLSIEDKKKEQILNKDSYVVVCASLGSDKEKIMFGRIEDILKKELDSYPQCMIIPAKLHFMEKEALNRFKIIN